MVSCIRRKLNRHCSNYHNITDVWNHDTETPIIYITCLFVRRESPNSRNGSEALPWKSSVCTKTWNSGALLISPN
uniref:Uncharacterized protein n=1 Tax=Mesocestoides corti TaxID=53468 RepID=A0A5K3FLS2_MESCO